MRRPVFCYDVFCVAALSDAQQRRSHALGGPGTLHDCRGRRGLQLRDDGPQERLPPLRLRPRLPQRALAGPCPEEENIDVMDFALSNTEMAAIRALDK